MRAWLLAILLAGCSTVSVPTTDVDEPVLADSFEPYVVVATLDTGGNLFHPTWLRPDGGHPSQEIRSYPADAAPLALNFSGDYVSNVEASRAALALLGGDTIRYVPGTNIIGMWSREGDAIPVFDVDAVLDGNDGTAGSHSHGGQASTQIAGLNYSIAPDAHIVIMDRTDDSGGTAATYATNAEGLIWAADQPWIDIIHTNIQNPVPLAREHPLSGSDPVGFTTGYPEAVAYAVAAGKLVVSAGGNFWVEPTETSPHAGVPGVLVAGANDNCGYTDFSNPDPHVVMDGYQTVSGAADSDGDDTFGGTSSASPRISGYAAQLLLEARRAVNDTNGWTEGYLILTNETASMGPLADGRLHASELHEVIRKTADPNPHASRFDGGEGICIPQPVDSPVAVYAKMGYGEVSEHTLEHALDVLLGNSPMPERVEDTFYTASEAVRTAAWS